MARKQVTEGQALEVRRLLDEGELSNKAIARETGVSHGTVSAMRLGRRGDGATVHNGRKVEEEEELPPAAPYCGLNECGVCVACRALEYWRRAHRTC